MKLDTKTLTAGLADELQAALTSEKNIGEAAKAQLTALAAELLPLASAEVVKLINGTQDATVVQAYLHLIEAIIPARAAAIALDAAYQQPKIIAQAVAGWMEKVAGALKDPTVQVLLKAAVAAVAII